MIQILLVLGAVFCAFQVMRTGRLLIATMWLAATSALVATLLYTLGAPEVAVIELSVGAGLVTVLFVFAFSIVGEETLDAKSLVPKPLVWGLVLLAAFLLGWLVLPQAVATLPQAGSGASFAQVLWQQRGLDVLAQVVLIFAGVLGLLGLLSESRQAAAERAAQPALQAAGLPAGAGAPVETPLPQPLAAQAQAPVTREEVQA